MSTRRSYLGLVVKNVRNDKRGETFEVPRYSDYQGKYVWQPDAVNTVTAHLSGAADAWSSF